MPKAEKTLDMKIGCDHPYDNIVDERVRFKFTGNHTLEKPDGGSVNVSVKFCTGCNQIVDLDGFDNGTFPISRLEDVIKREHNDTCRHPYDNVAKEEVTFEIVSDEHEVESGFVPKWEIEVCEDCYQFFYWEQSKLPIVTEPSED